ncbi:10901_t:CDS:10 [Diversispora eburnea]|uniref:10901_t:CDS:1 n=1 Tax=Diversispora eburnea TaxID=1213867 RepID=A0A9N8V0F9_9GLOM|nr:10901_t:CDS:10 [Diversispora eburnea]
MPPQGIKFYKLDITNREELEKKYVDLASSVLGSSVEECSDEFFAKAINLLKPGKPIRDAGRFTERGAWYDGWETRRHNPAFDWVVIKLGYAGHITGFNIDTAHFNGNHAPIANVEVCYSEKNPLHTDNTEWIEVLPKVDLEPSSEHFFGIPKTLQKVSHVRLNIYPDGGVARFRVYGIVSAKWPSDPTTPIDLAFIGNEAVIVACSDQHYAKVENILLPGRGVDMSDGWETKRSRQKNHFDWVIVKLGSPGYLESAEIDTAFYIGNYPQEATLEGCYSKSFIPDKITKWTQILERSKLGPHKQHFFKLSVKDIKFSHVRLTIYPDGGIKRLRIIGRQKPLLQNNFNDSPVLPPVNCVIAQPLTYESYAPYGHIIQAFQEPQSISQFVTTVTHNICVTPANQGTARKYNHIAPVINIRQNDINNKDSQFIPKATPNLSLYRCLPVKKPVKIDLLERHLYSSQAFIPMCGGTNYLIVVCLSDHDGKPDLKTLKSFLCSSSQGINYYPGVWHHPMIALDETTNFVCLTHESGVPNQDCEEIEIGYMEFEDWAIQFIDTPQFQRLRDVKQLGVTYYVFPGASHNRFEHSLGTGHLAYNLVNRIHRQQPGLDSSETDLKCVTLAALCHDLGHGPYSHVFDNEVIPTLRPKPFEWRHENGSVMMLNHLIESEGIELSSDDIKFIEALITGEKLGIKRSPYLFDIVANKRNSVDVDKFDYIERDCYHLGMKSKFEFSRLMQFSRIIDDEIVYHHKESFNIYELFHTRYSLHKRIYTHRVSKAIDYMVRDALVEADPVFHIADSIDNPEEYLKLSDSILTRIEYSDDPGLEKSKEIIKNIRHRKLYKFVDECLIPYKMDIAENKLNSFEIVSHQSGSDLNEDDVIVERLKMNYGKKDKNPVDNVKFYDRYRQNEAFNLSRSEVSYLVPEQYEEEIVRIFARDSSKVKQIQEAFRRLTKNQGFSIPENYVPKKLKRHRSFTNSTSSERASRVARISTPDTL